MRLGAAAFVSVVLAATPAAAAKRTIAVFPFAAASASDQANADTLTTKLTAELKNAGRGQVNLVFGPKLQRALRDKPARALARCGGNSRCTAELAGKAGADEALIVSVSGMDSGLQLLIVAIDAEKEQIARTVIVALPNAGAIKTAEMRSKWREALGLQSGQAADSGDMLALPESLEAPAPKASQEPPPLVAPTVATATPTQVSAPIAADTRIIAPPARSRGLLYGGLVTLGLAAAAGGVGAYFGVQFLTTPRTAPEGTTQLQYQQRVEAANRSALIANVALGAAGALAVTSIAMIIVDVSRARAAPVQVGVMPQGNGASAVISGAF